MARRILLGIVAGAFLVFAGSQVAAEDSLGDKIKAAMDRGVSYLKTQQNKDGMWLFLNDQSDLPLQKNVGATALAGLALLECGVPAKDAVIQKAGAAVREHSPRLTFTYSVALSIMFLDRLGDPADVSLVQSLAVRLLAGQGGEPNFGWGYDCPELNKEETARLTVLARSHNEKLASKTLPIISIWPRKRLTTKDVPQEILAQFGPLKQQGGRGGDDNSNTQFGALGLWIGRRYGLSVDGDLARVAGRFRNIQNQLGGWGYPLMGTEPTPEPGMICAGLLGLAVGDGLALDRARTKNPKGLPAKARIKDPSAAKGLVYLSTLIGEPGAKLDLKGKDFYFLWSLERVGVVYGLQKINKKDWYAWGAQALIDNQGTDGSWHGDYAAGGCDTSFSLLFLCRSNLFPDLTASLEGLQKGELGLVTGGNKLPRNADDLNPNKTDKGIQKTNPKNEAKDDGNEKSAAQMTKELVQAAPAEQERMIGKFQAEKGVAYTDALAEAIPMLKGAAKTKARAALTERLTRMTPATLRDKFQDDNLEIRRSAALACAKKKARDHVPDLINLLNDPELPVILAAHQSLVDLTGKDFGPEADATRAERKEAAARWQAWWKERGK